MFQIVIGIPISDPAHVQFWQRHDLCYIICTLFLTRTSVLVCLPTSIKSANTSPVCTTTCCECTEPGSCCGMQLCIADIALRCQNSSWSHTLSHETMHNTACCACYVMMTCTAFVCSAISTFLSREFSCTLVSSKVAQLCTDSPYHHCTSSSGDATCSDRQWQRSCMVHVQCGLHEQHTHSWSGTTS